MKFLLPILFLAFIISCGAAQKPLKEFIYGEFVMDGAATRKVLEPLPHVQKIEPEDKRKKWLERMTAENKERTLTVKKDKIIRVAKTYVEHYDMKIIKETAEKITVEIKITHWVDRETGKKIDKDLKPKKLDFYFYDKEKTFLALTNEHFTWFKIWKRK